MAYNKNCTTIMINTRNEYNSRLNEVEIYFDALSFLDKGTCEVKCIDILGAESTMPVDDNLSRILKANGFLLLYNLIESTIRKSIGAIFAAIHSSSSSYKDLSSDLRKLWVKQECKNATIEKIMNIADSILADELISFKEDCITISGNIDAQEIRKILKQFGGNEIRNGRNLKTIKDKRNNLAHGEFSFSEIGKDYTVQDLIKYKNDVKEYLDKVLDEIQQYIEYKNYLKP